MEFNEDFIKETGLSTEQVTKINEVSDAEIAELKKEWDSKANENAEKIIDGAAVKVETLTGIKRERGQKIVDYLGLASENYVKGSKASIEQKQQELDKKIASYKGDESLKEELQLQKSKLDELQKKEAKFDEWEKEDYKTKYEDSTKKLISQTEMIAFANVKPNFPNVVNSYEAKGRWNEFISGVKEKYDIKIDENNEGIAIDKENEHKFSKLSELVARNKELTELTKGREALGLNSDNKQSLSIDGLPFAIPENANAQERQKSIRDYLENDYRDSFGNPISITSGEYSKKFAEYNKIILEKNPQKKKN